MRHSIHLARSSVVAGLAVALAASALASCNAARQQSADAPRSFYGIVQDTPLDKADFVRMGRAKVGALRFEIYWPTIQATRAGGFNWSSTDSTVAWAAQQRIGLLPILLGTPTFEMAGCQRCGGIQIRTRAQRADWKRFVSAAVHRYGPRGSFWRQRPKLRADPITQWQILNEQNNPVYREPAHVYARLLALSRRAIDSVDPNGRVILGGMFGTPVGSRKAGVSAWSYLSLLFKAGARRDFDAVALHPYSPNLAGISYQIEKIRAVLKAHHEPRTPILITEIGWGSGGKRRHPGTGSRGQVFVVGPKRQATNLTDSFNLLTSHRKRWNIGGIYWFTWKDPTNPPPGLCAFCYSSGLYRSNGKTAKPALSAYEGFTDTTHAN